MRVPLFDIQKQNRSLQKEIQQAIASVLQTGAYIDGPAVTAFEKSFAKSCDQKYCVGVGNGTDALFLALKVLGIGAGDEVITTSYSFVATAQAITRTAAKVRFADIERATCNIDVSSIERLITRRTRAIMPVHLFGYPCNIQAIQRLARRHRLHIVEDAAQAHGATVAGQPVGSFGTLACFSFYPTKNLGGIGDGGAVVTDNSYLAGRVRSLSRHARLPDADYSDDGINSRLDAIQATVLSVKLKHLSGWTKRRQFIAARYQQRLNKLPIGLPPENDQISPAFHVYPIRIPNGQRESMQRHLLNNGIETRVYYPRTLPRVKAFRNHLLAKQKFPEANRASREMLGLPMSPEMTNAAADHVAKCVAQFFAARGTRHGAA